MRERCNNPLDKRYADYGGRGIQVHPAWDVPTGWPLFRDHVGVKPGGPRLLEPETLRQLSARPERLIELVEGNAAKPQVIIDEVQKLPALLEVVHLLIERKTGQQFILTGSSARTLRRH